MKIRIVGCGNMGSSLAQALVDAGAQISLYDKEESRTESLSRAIGAKVAKTALEDLYATDVLLLAVKPQDFKSVADELQEFAGLVASVMTGVTIDRLKQSFSKCTVLRMMPNLAVRYGDGVVALAEDPQLEPFKQRIEEMFTPLGMLKWIHEKHFDAITALTGSGPAFIFTLIEAMVDAAIALGFSADTGYDLVKQMVGGAMTMLYEAPESPAELRWKVSSPSGTTIAGLRTLEKHGVRSAIIETFCAAYNRAKELGNAL